MSAKKRTIDAFFGTPKSNTIITKKPRSSPIAAGNAQDDVVKHEDLENDGLVSKLCFIFIPLRSLLCFPLSYSLFHSLWVF
jgi:hypothetical protein